MKTQGKDRDIVVLTGVRTPSGAFGGALTNHSAIEHSALAARCATGATVHLLHALRGTGRRSGIGSACLGGGQGAAVMVEAFAT
jgi:acetyl-CoA acetyltransferase